MENGGEILSGSVETLSSPKWGGGGKSLFPQPAHTNNEKNPRVAF